MYFQAFDTPSNISVGFERVQGVGSLVPRPFPPPVFDRLQYANTEGEGLGDFVTCGYVG